MSGRVWVSECADKRFARASFNGIWPGEFLDQHQVIRCRWPVLRPLSHRHSPLLPSRSHRLERRCHPRDPLSAGAAHSRRPHRAPSPLALHQFRAGNDAALVRGERPRQFIRVRSKAGTAAG